MNPHALVWGICALASVGVVTRPFRWPEGLWPASGALLLVLLGSMSLGSAWEAIASGTDVYLFLIGMMLLSEVARREGLFDWVATLAVRHANASPRRLFLLVYIVGTVVTVFLSNDATAVVLTPAVCTVARKAGVRALPLLFVCAFVANAASFVLPISNPANLVLFGSNMPPLGDWVARFALPSLLSIVVTYAVLRWTQRRQLTGTCSEAPPGPALDFNGRLALFAIAATAVTLLVVSALGLSLGLPTALLGGATALVVQSRRRESPSALLKGVSWSVLPLVAGLFVLVGALDQTGVTRTLAMLLHDGATRSESLTAALAASSIAFASNLVNNLPAGLIASSSIAIAHSPPRVIDAVLIGVDLGPNLSMTGSLATILWLTAIRRAGEDVSFWTFFWLGLRVMPPALLLALAARLLVS